MVDPQITSFVLWSQLPLTSYVKPFPIMAVLSSPHPFLGGLGSIVNYSYPFPPYPPYKKGISLRILNKRKTNARGR